MERHGAVLSREVHDSIFVWVCLVTSGTTGDNKTNQKATAVVQGN
jgi:hypothetical protein